MRKLLPQETRRLQRSIVCGNDWKLVSKKIHELARKGVRVNTISDVTSLESAILGFEKSKVGKVFSFFNFNSSKPVWSARLIWLEAWRFHVDPKVSTFDSMRSDFELLEVITFFSFYQSQQMQTLTTGHGLAKFTSLIILSTSTNKYANLLKFQNSTRRWKARLTKSKSEAGFRHLHA